MNEKKKITAYYEGCKNNADVIKMIDRELDYNGCDRSFDGSLCVYHFKTFICIVGTCQPTFYER